ncbi:uncharacterized protein BP5553_08516 [Venustampulla echinocandica]|uniref:Uncharacterized protein n=1 Tax=Venustampulla echinocandica TaxID=2656787 RepID=A0A370TEF9_9HELO|nr:uncharacterized protein BP5553_08516 [Venustampulla echinocandica]RDL33077.1 hypothetical protein BP5553_08516 [Venustampulla echinocandica]
MTYLSLLAMAAAIPALLAFPTESNPLEVREDPTPTLGDYTGQKSQYEDGSGTYVRSDDSYTYRPSGDYCWTDTFFVTKEDVAQAWTKADTEVDCATTQSCSTSSINSTNACITWTFDNHLDVSMTWIKDVLSVGYSVGFSYSDQRCYSSTSSNTCTWDDKACHATWTSNVNYKVSGYIRRRCNYVTGAKEQTIWSHDYTTIVPALKTRLGCGASCSDTSYPAEIPPV